MPLQLFDGSDSDNDDISKIKINEEYAHRFEHNKRREELQRYEELKKKGAISSLTSSGSESGEESESESSDDDVDYEKLLSSRRRDKEFFDALLKVKKQDPSLKQKDVKLFVSDDSSEDEDEKNKAKDKKNEKPMYLKDVMAKHLIEEGPDFGDEDGEVIKKDKGKSESTKGKKDKLAKKLMLEESGFVNKDGKTYGDEQEELKRAVLEAVEREGLEDEGDFFTVKEKVDEDKVDSDDKEFEEKLDEYFGDESNENAKFLKNYFMNKMQEEYEYRFQENQEDRVLGHARKVEGSVRKKTNTRKEQRKSKEERMAIAQKEREDELKHLKNLKKQEIQEKVKKIMSTAGIHEDEIIPLSAAEIEDEFDPEEYDRMMKAAFDEKYYNAEDADPGFGSENDDDMEKPDFEKEDELLGLPKGWDSTESHDGFSAARERVLKEKMENDSDSDSESKSDHQESEDEKEEKVPEEGSRKRKRKTALLEKAKQAMMDEYYKLDYEDTIGDLKTRFKYAKTKPNRFGMSAPELLLMDDTELNQYVSLKKLAPYRDEEWKLSKQKRHMLKMRTKELLREAGSKKNKKSKRDSSKSTLSNGVAENGKASTEDSNVNAENNLSRKARRRQRASSLKLSRARALAYGKIPSKSKHGGKN
ncbi:hypothetical protein AAHE18_14G068700 [Arachis hypogaea]